MGGGRATSCTATRLDESSCRLMYYLHSLTVGMAMQSRRKRSRRDYVRGEIQRTVASLTMNRSSEAKTMLHPPTLDADI